MPKAIIAILYPGALGSVMARALVEKGHRVVTTLGSRSARTRERAVGLEVLPSLAEVARLAEVVVSLVPPSVASTLAVEFAAQERGDRAAPLYIDANALSRERMTEVERTLQGSGVRVADAMFLGSSREFSRGRIYASGPEANEVVALFDGVVDARVFGSHVGDASAFKLAFSGLLKGLAALLFEVGVAAHAQGFLEDMLREYRDLSSIGGFLDEALPSYVAHAPRRAAELAELVDELTALGLSSRMTLAAQQVVERVARVDFISTEPRRSEDLLASIAAAGVLRTEK